MGLTAGHRSAGARACGWMQRATSSVHPRPRRDFCHGAWRLTCRCDQAQCSTAQAKGARLVAVTSVRVSRLDAACDMSVHLPLERELCPWGLAPVTSAATQMLFGDTVAIALMQARILSCMHVRLDGCTVSASRARHASGLDL